MAPLLEIWALAPLGRPQLVLVPFLRRQMSCHWVLVEPTGTKRDM